MTIDDGKVHEAVPVTTPAEATPPPTQLEVMIKESKLSPTKAQILLSKFNHYFESAAKREKQIDALQVTDVSQVAEMKAASALRKELKKDRTAIENARVELNEENQAEIKIVNSIAKVLTALIEPLEAKATKIEKFAETQAKLTKEKLQGERMAIVSQWDYTGTQDLAAMTSDEFEAFKTGLQTVHERKEKEAQERLEREAKEKQLQEDRFNQLMAYPTRFNPNPYGYQELYKYSEEQWAGIIKFADEYTEKLKRLADRKNVIAGMGLVSKPLASDVEGVSRYGSIVFTDSELMNMDQALWEELLSKLTQYAERLVTLKERQTQLVTLGYSFDKEKGAFINGDHSIVLAVMQSYDNNSWSELLLSIRESAEKNRERRMQLEKVIQIVSALPRIKMVKDGLMQKLVFSSRSGLPWMQDVSNGLTKEEADALIEKLRKIDENDRRILMLDETVDLVGTTIANVRYYINERLQIQWSLNDMLEFDIHTFNQMHSVYLKSKIELDGRDRFRIQELEKLGFKKTLELQYNRSEYPFLQVNPQDFDLPGSEWGDRIANITRQIEVANEEASIAAAPVKQEEPVKPKVVVGIGGAGGHPRSSPATSSEAFILRKYGSAIDDIKPPCMQSPKGEMALKNIELLKDKLLGYINDCAKSLE